MRSFKLYVMLAKLCTLGKEASFSTCSPKRSKAKEEEALEQGMVGLEGAAVPITVAQLMGICCGQLTLVARAAAVASREVGFYTFKQTGASSLMVSTHSYLGYSHCSLDRTLKSLVL